MEDRLSLGAGNDVALRLQNRSRYDLRLLVRDEAPQDFRLLAVQGASGPPSASPPAPIGRVDVRGLGTAALRYEVLPVRRGVYRFGGVTVRYPTGLGLLLRQHTYPLAREVRVYPNLRDVKRYDLALRRGQLQEVGLRRTGVEPSVGVTMREPMGFDLEMSW